MTTLNNRLQLALLNRKKGQNALEKGFTLVELMIVIVIVGILSAVALPNFISQTDKAKATEAKSLAKAYLSNLHIASLESASAVSTATKKVNGSPSGACPIDANDWAYVCTTSSITATNANASLTVTGSVDGNGQITITD